MLFHDIAYCLMYYYYIVSTSHVEGNVNVKFILHIFDANKYSALQKAYN